jgi:hypothetical protein
MGKADRYHETITVAYLALIQQCMFERGDDGDWANFAQSNPELFNPELLGHFYDRDVLESTKARRVFLLPRSQPFRGESPANIGKCGPVRG